VLVGVAAQARASGVLTWEMLPVVVQQPLAARRRAVLAAPGWDALLGVRRDAAPNREELRRVLEHYNGNVSRVAAFFRRERRQVYRWAEQLSLDIHGSRAPIGSGDGPERSSSEGEGA